MDRNNAFVLTMEMAKWVDTSHHYIILELEPMMILFQLTKELVPSDIVKFRVGDKVPADMQVLSLISSIVRVEHGSLIENSETMSKTVKVVYKNSDIRGKMCGFCWNNFGQ